jgi:hypothetical protein
VGYSSANIQPLANRQYEDENFEPNIAKDTHKPIDENAIRVFISYSKHNESDAQCFKRLFERRKPVIGGKEVVIWTMQQLLAGSSVNEQIQENLNKSDFGFGALSQQFLQLLLSL